MPSIFRLRLAALIAATLAGSIALTGCDSGPSGNVGTGHHNGVPVGGVVSPDGSMSPGGSASPVGSPSPSIDPLAGNPFVARVPHFPPAPPPQPITVPDGPTVPIYHRLPVDQPVAFLTMDDGWTQLPEAIELMRAANIPFTIFLLAPVGARNPGFFKQLTTLGGVIEDHTINHPELKGKSYATQHHEICDAKSSLEHTFGTTMKFFRPPFGDYDHTTLKAARDCGLTAGFHWSETVNNGTVYYQTSVHKIRPGDIILMHFRPAFVNDVLAALKAIHDSGLTPALLEDYVR